MAIPGRSTPRQALERPQAGVSDLGVTVLACVSIAVPLLFYLHQHVQMLRYGYEIEALKQRKVALVERHRELQATRDRAARLDRVEEEASRMGLVASDVLPLDAVGGPEQGASDASAPDRAPSARRE